MEKEKLKRKVLFETTKDKDDIAFDFKIALISWKKFHNKQNTAKLKQVLGVENVVNVEIVISDTTQSIDESLRLYVYKTKKCNIHEIGIKQFSHAIQVSLGNNGMRKNWVIAEEGFSAKVFPVDSKMLINLVEDVILDIQMFYAYGYENDFYSVELRKEFSLKKVEYLLHKEVVSYLGSVEDAQYISFASFCRNDMGEIDFESYKEMWENFERFLKSKVHEKIEINSRTIISKDTINLLLECHPKGRQLSINRIEKKLRTLPNGKYVLVRTEKKPKKSNQCVEVQNRFGMKKWKTGKIKIVPLLHRFTYEKMMPYVSCFEFEWRG